MDYKTWWQKDRLNNVIVDHGNIRILDFVRSCLAPFKVDTYLDFGCGPGRFTSLFPAQGYVGVDLNPECIMLGRMRHPGHKFGEVDFLDILIKVDCIFTYAVLLHIADEDIDAVLDQLCDSAKTYVVVAEVMDKGWRHSPIYYNRSIEEYVKLMSRRGFYLCTKRSTVLKRYADNPKGLSSELTLAVFNRQ